MAQHTPSPWIIEDIIYADYVAIEAHTEKQCVEIASIGRLDHGARLTREQAANLYLIAAAPDLLAACDDPVQFDDKIFHEPQWMMCFIADRLDERGDTGMAGFLRAKAARETAAIAKANGKQEEAAG